MPTTSELKSKGKKRLKRQNRLIEKMERGQLSMKPKQVRARARRYEHMARDALEVLYKPVADWDVEELANGRPRNAEGKFIGRKPEWVTREVHEEAVRRFQEVARTDVQALVPLAIKTVEVILRADGVDKRGRPTVPASVRLDAAKWLVEHVIGKPTQRKEIDISMRLQAVLGSVIVSPTNKVLGAEGTEGLMGELAGSQAGGFGAGFQLADGMELLPSTSRPGLVGGEDVSGWDLDEDEE